MVELLLDALDAAKKVEDLNLLTLGTHPLKGNRKGEWGMTVTKNWRIKGIRQIGAILHAKAVSASAGRVCD